VLNVSIDLRQKNASLTTGSVSSAKPDAHYRINLYNGNMISSDQTTRNETLPHDAGIKRYGEDGLRELMTTLGEPAYRARQLVRWLYARAAQSYDEMTDLPAALRDRLREAEPIAAPEVVRVQHSSDGTRKYLLRLIDGALIETVGLPGTERLGAAGRLTVCFSTQVGCAMGCAFCATGQLGLTRQLAPGEMVDQLLIVARDFDTRVTNAVAMGEGEPLANYDASLAALRLMNSPDGLGIGARHLTLSTCGPLPQLRRFARESEQFTLAVSLHSAVQATRDKLMPVMARYPLSELRLSLINYAKTGGRRPTLEYALIRDVNDTDAEITALVSFCQNMLVHVNLIPLNEDGKLLTHVAADAAATGISQQSAARTTLKPAPPSRFQEVAHTLQQAGIETSIRRSRGADIAGACGQLTAQEPTDMED
jgi:23S rRNA (adenine2503-C2)-methyltransferase